jgi:hypothetical protein
MSKGFTNIQLETGVKDRISKDCRREGNTPEKGIL